MTTTIIGFPRLGEFRELKFATEKYFRNEINESELQATAKELRRKHWQLVKESGVDEVVSNDFSLYDNLLDTAFLFNIIPSNVETSPLSSLEKFFALARGHQSETIDIKALPMKKWFNTNYHYLVPKFEKITKVKINSSKIFDEYQEAKALDIETRPVLIGPFTLLSLADFEEGISAKDFVNDLTIAYQDIFKELKVLGAQWIQLDEPSLVTDLSVEQKALFLDIYHNLLNDKQDLKILLQTYFGDVRDIYQDLIQLSIDAIGLDFVEGPKNISLLQTGFPADKKLYAGIINGKNIWRNQYQKSLAILQQLPTQNVVLNTSCSLLHVPFSIENEEFPVEVKKHFSYATEKLNELVELSEIVAGKSEKLEKNQALFQQERFTKDPKVEEKIASLTPESYIRQPAFEKRELLQRKEFQLPLLPTTTIGSFPQTKEVKQTRARFKKKEIDQKTYDQFIAQQIDNWLQWQEEIDLDVLVHGEFERNDMVEYFGQNLAGYLFSKNGWVQSYGTRGVKPPIIWGDIYRTAPITVKWSKYAQKQTNKWVKGMLTGPVTILNWSFPREDISLKESTLQIALAIQEEVLDLEKNGIRIIQIDEAALREKLPLRKNDWYSEYLDWAIPAFRLVHSKVQPQTQIHTHMCYSEFTDIIPAIDQMDADVISFEASRSNLEILDELKANHFKTQVGPGVYDIHSPRIPSTEEIKTTIDAILAKVPQEKIWINPDCGLKTRGIKETKASLQNMTAAAKFARKELLIHDKK
ncbi:5-methyltetrahydropteroyltriglutamate--homocysteine S-methyltransferase [Enterococcus sp. ALS3]|uniref:5-methyltetrahydropteroyltriglutamate--homocysteine methyltransferase n=1 Tax=Enterococcus alishanensis TaxID=1303817 RepID=A0ABS6T9Y5_9ENTE|nr:5-methyltetrahydropteroyltriglutamate--homocysteine S-methyltransferase [Enterococcus alishanensis]MBV7389695.1 5-methyltetrahydropteroyltriglutamate--homocysteine S-methyltransferase [Enterococcus alishanensis]